MVPVYTPLCAQERQLEQGGGLFFLILPLSPDLPSSGLPSICPPEGCTPICCFVDDDDLQHSMCEELRRFRKPFYITSIQHLMQRLNMCADVEEDFVEK